MSVVDPLAESIAAIVVARLRERHVEQRNMIQSGVPETVAMQISGHRTQSMLHRYNIIAERDIVAAAAKIQHHLEIQGSRKLGENLGEADQAKPLTVVC